MTYADGGVQVKYFFNCTNEEDLDPTDLEEQTEDEHGSVRYPFGSGTHKGSQALRSADLHTHVSCY